MYCVAASAPDPVCGLCLRRPTAEDAYNWLQDLVSETGEDEVRLLSTALSTAVYWSSTVYGLSAIYCWSTVCRSSIVLFTACFLSTDRLLSTARRMFIVCLLSTDSLVSTACLRRACCRRSTVYWLSDVYLLISTVCCMSVVYLRGSS